MFKRLFWMMIGAGFGFGASLWLTRTVRQTVERYGPERVRTLPGDLRAAVVEGRDAMRSREAELRRQLARG
jgi:hypothetical protein